MTPTRRQFLSAAGAATVAGLAPAGQPGGMNRVRKDVASLNAASPDIVALKKAVGMMKNGVDQAGGVLPATDGRRWLAQAAIHGTADGFGACQHANWFFLPWHRLYLYYFEEVVRGLSGNDTFALPYWDWTRTRTLPALFWQDAVDPDNPLDNPPRAGAAGSGRRPGLTAAAQIEDPDYNRFFSQTVISRILNIDDFETFAGGAVARLGEASFAGRLESGPHNRTHNWVGGDMGTGGSPQDPIFWLHHCNVDRLWTEWDRRHRGAHPSDRGWLDARFEGFFGRNGTSVAADQRIAVSGTLRTNDLGYEYDRRLGDPVVVGAAPRREPKVFGTVNALGSPVGTPTAMLFAPMAGEDFTKKVNSLIDSPLDEVGGRIVRLRLSGVQAPKDPTTVLDVFLNCQKLDQDTPISDPSYVGSCTFFEHGQHGHDMKKKENGLTFTFDLTPDLSRLYGDRPLKAGERLQIGVLRRRPDAAGKLFGPAEIQLVKPEQVTLDVIGPKE